MHRRSDLKASSQECNRDYLDVAHLRDADAITPAR
jgi:hypothetical protein